MPAKSFLKTLLLSLALALFAWNAGAQNVESALQPGKVIQGHAKWEEQCEKCHTRFNKADQQRLCLDCHKDTAQNVRDHKGYHGRLKDEERDCRNCHTDHKGRNAKIVELDKDKFDHSITNFPLRDKHKVVKCADCHKPNEKWTKAPLECNACHKKDDVHKGELGAGCQNCHSEKSWKDAKFDHDKTKFPISAGRHADVECTECHETKKYKSTPKDCYSCHQEDDDEMAHKGRYGKKCETCHSDKDWDKSKFNHDHDTKYPLKGKHHDTKCDKCHLPTKPLYDQHLSTKCVACHKKDDQEKGHQGTLGDKCEACHNEKEWKTNTFDHDKDTKFPLHDAHKKAKCETCHKGGISGKTLKDKEKLPKDCNGCHKKNDFDKGHKGRYGVKCEVCHNEKEWKDTKLFNHDRDTKYTLKGKHIETKCDKCHTVERGPIYQDHKLAKLTCNDCHKKDDFDKGHKGQLGTKCEDCHDEKQWKGVKYDHNKSKFPLTGVHGKVECKECHATPAYKDAKVECYACHKNAKKDDTDKLHSGDVHNGAFGTKCESCHNTRSWKSWDFDHSKTSFKIEGKHIPVKCKECHKKPAERVAGKLKESRNCYACHAKDDVHDGGFSIVCERCHVDTSWRTIRGGAGVR
jgi:hypothetical protein